MSDLERVIRWAKKQDYGEIVVVLEEHQKEDAAREREMERLQKVLSEWQQGYPGKLIAELTTLREAVSRWLDRRAAAYMTPDDFYQAMLECDLEVRQLIEEKP